VPGRALAGGRGAAPAGAGLPRAPGVHAPRPLARAVRGQGRRRAAAPAARHPRHRRRHALVAGRDRRHPPRPGAPRDPGPPGRLSVRFVITGEWSRNRLLQTIVVLYCIYVALLWVTNALLYFQKMDLGAASVVA